MSTVDGELLETLSKQFGFADFREGQLPVIKKVMAGESSLAIFPTGSGKSLCYQFSALHLPHLTLVVSPLLALIKDQLDFLASKDISAASIDSSVTAQDSQKIMRDVRDGRIKLLMVSVERFKNERFRQFIAAVPISMMVVDEAHCISEWGHNFRPDYLKLQQIMQELDIPVALLLTATATAAVKHDMAKKFKISAGNIVQTGFYRANLDLQISAVSTQNKRTALLNLMQDGAGIVYVTLQKTAEFIADFLRAQGVVASAYHAGLESAKRETIQRQFMQGEVPVIVATIAFGMGIDKSDIRFVVHYDLPKSIENYSQEIGRAGRDGNYACCTTLANLDGMTTVQNFVFGDTPELDSIQMVVDHIANNTLDGRWELQLVSLSNACNIRQLPLKTLLVQLELQGAIKPLFAYYGDFNYKFLSDQSAILASFGQERQQFLRDVFQCSNFKRIWGSPDFDVLYSQYGHERGRIVQALEYLAEKQMIELQTKRMVEVFSVDSDVFTKPGIALQLHRYFIEKEEKEIGRIAALVDFFQQEHCLSHTLANYFDDDNAPLHCGHCSVCSGNPAVLSYSTTALWPNDAEISSAVLQLQNKLRETGQAVSVISCCRFLAGLTTPLFTRYKVRQLKGFALCSELPYADIKQKLHELGLSRE